MSKKIKRVDDKQEAEVDPVIKANPVVSAPSGVFVMNQEEVKEMLAGDADKHQKQTEPDDATKQVTHSAKKHKKVITVDPGNHEPMEEVSYASFLKVKDAEIAKDNAPASATDKIKSLIGEHHDTAIQVLEDLKARKILSNYRIVPIGAVSSMDFQPGRVQLLVDLSKMVVDVMIS